VVGNLLHLPSTAATITGAALCFGLRVMAIQRGWHLPIAHPPEQSEEAQAMERSDDHNIT
jgi:hypothetical protein